MKKWPLFIALPLLLVGGWLAVKAKQAQNATFQPPIMPDIIVDQIVANLAEVTLTQTAQVSVKAETEQLLTARVTAQVIDLPFREGDEVKAGQVLAQLDDKSSRAEVSLAQAQLAQYKLEQASIQDQVSAAKLDVTAQKDTLSRLKKLSKINAASEDQLQQQQVKLAQAEQRLSSASSQLKAYDELLTARNKQSEAAQGALGYVRLTALTEGKVAERLVQEGDIVTAGTPIIRIIGQDGKRRLLISQPTELTRPQGILWKDHVLPLTQWPRANAQGLVTYEANLTDPQLMPNQQIALPFVVYQGEGILLPSLCFIPHNQQQAQVLVYEHNTANAMTISLAGIGKEGAVTQESELAGKSLLCASSDILLRIMAGRTFQIK